MKIIGISAFYHDSAAALVSDGRIVAAAQEERFTRIKHDAAFPRHALEYCLREANCTLNDIDHIVFYDKPFLKFERLLMTFIENAPRGFSQFRKSMPVWLKDKLFQKSQLQKHLAQIQPGVDYDKKLLFSEHHLSHAASAFFPSPFEESVVLTMDGVGEWTTTSVSIGRGLNLKIEKEILFPDSLGLLYSAFTYYTGFKVNSGEYKVMGLAPYGKPTFKQKILDNLIDLKPDGTFKLNMYYFDFAVGLKMINQRFEKLFGIKTRNPDERLEQVHMDFAASIQAVIEEAMLRLTKSLYQEFKIPNLCLAGGVALNCVANGKVLKDNQFKNIWIQPASGDAGGALGAALFAYHSFLKQPRITNPLDSMSGGYLGPKFSTADVVESLKSTGAKFEVIEDDQQLLKKVADDLSSGRSIGWSQGRMEFGPRALGSRSILADPRSPVMQKNLNLKIKYRESFRPFAPAVLREDLAEWFDMNVDSPYMLLVTELAPQHSRKMTEEEERLFGIDKLNVVRSEIPAVTHVDYSARIQTVHKETNPRFHQLLLEFKQRTGCPVLVNTSFNVRGEPIVCSPEDAFRCFMGTDLDTLVIENVYLRKENQDPALKENYTNKFEMD